MTDHEFFTGNEQPSNRVYEGIVKALNSNDSYSFACPGDFRLFEMRNVVYILWTKDSPEPIGDTVPLEFTFSNCPSKTLNCPTNNLSPTESNLSSLDKMLRLGTMVSKCKFVGKAIIFSNGNETIIINRRFFTSVHVKA